MWRIPRDDGLREAWNTARLSGVNRSGSVAAWGRAADALTASRALVSIPLALVTTRGKWAATAVLLCAAWWSDFLDGRLARRAAAPTRLGDWDLTADTVVGAGLVVGLVAGGHLPLLWGVVAALFGAGFILTGNEAHSMLLQAMGYGPALWLIAGTTVAGSALVGVTLASIAIVDCSRLFEYVLPSFFAGISGRRHRAP